MACDLEQIFWLNITRLRHQHYLNALMVRKVTKIFDIDKLNVSLYKRLLLDQARVFLKPLAENLNQHTKNISNKVKMPTSKNNHHPRLNRSMISKRRLSLRPREPIKRPKLSPNAHSDGEDIDSSRYGAHCVNTFEPFRQPHVNKVHHGHLPEPISLLLKKPKDVLQLSTKPVMLHQVPTVDQLPATLQTLSNWLESPPRKEHVPPLRQLPTIPVVPFETESPRQSTSKAESSRKLLDMPLLDDNLSDESLSANHTITNRQNGDDNKASSPPPSLNIPGSHTPNLNETSYTKPNRSPILPVVNDSNVLNNTAQAIQQLIAELDPPSSVQTSFVICENNSDSTLIPAEQFVPYTNIGDIVQVPNQSDSIVLSQSSGLSWLELSSAAASPQHEPIFEDPAYNFCEVRVVLRRVNVVKCLARLRRNKNRRLARALKRQQALAPKSKLLNETPKSPKAPIVPTIKHLPIGRKDMAKAMEAANIKPAKAKLPKVKSAPKLTQFTKPTMKRGRGRPSNNSTLQHTIANPQQRCVSNISLPFNDEDIEIPAEDDLEESCLKMACFMEDDSMELNQEDEFDGRKYLSQMRNTAYCCCFLQRDIALTHRFKNIQVPPIAHMNNMFYARRCVQSPPEIIKSENTIDLKPLDLVLDVPVRNDKFENPSDTGFDFPNNCENIYGGLPVSRPVVIQPIDQTFRASTPQTNHITLNMEPVVQAPPMQSVDQVHPNPFVSHVDHFDTNLELDYEVSSQQSNVEEAKVYEDYTTPSSSEQCIQRSHTQQMDEDSDNDDVISIYAYSNGSLSPILEEPTTTTSSCKPLQFRNFYQKEAEPKKFETTTNVIIPPLQMPHISSAGQISTGLAGFKIPKRNLLANDKMPCDSNTLLVNQQPPNRFQQNSINSAQLNTAGAFSAFPVPQQPQPLGLSLATQKTIIANTFGRHCYKFLNNRCPHAFGCQYPHSALPATELIRKALWSWPIELVYRAYVSFVARHKPPFVLYFDLFCDYFSERRQPHRLIEMVSASVINDEQLVSIYFTRIANALERCGFAKNEAINHIILANHVMTHPVVNALIELCTTNNETICAFFAFLQQWTIVSEYEFPVNCIKRLIDSVLISKNSGIIILIQQILNRTPLERSTHIWPALKDFLLMQNCNM